MHNSKKAIFYYNQAIKLDNNYISAIYNRANVYLKIAEFDKSLKDLTQVIELDPTFYQAYFNRGTLYKRLGKDLLSKKDIEHSKHLAKKDIETKYDGKFG